MHFAIHPKPHPIGAGRRAVLYWIVGYLTILYPLITIVVVRRDCFVFSDCEPESNPQRRSCQTGLSDLKLFLLQNKGADHVGRPHERSSRQGVEPTFE